MFLGQGMPAYQICRICRRIVPAEGLSRAADRLAAAPERARGRYAALTSGAPVAVIFE
jgi:hypothetical protein